MSVDVINSVYWQHRGKHHAKPAVDSDMLEAALDDAVSAVVAADGLLFITGAGMGVDMGLPDFRSSNHFCEELNHPEISRYEDFSDSKWFSQDPHLAWGLNFSQISSYREAEIHQGYRAMQALAKTRVG